MKFPTLYKKTISGDLQEWTIGVEGSTILTHWGRVGGKIQHGSDVISSGKNIGKQNETTPAEQAISEAKSHWEFKKKDGYVEDQSQAMAGKVDKIIEGGIFPMLAHKHTPKSKHLQYSCYVQPKLDGHRCIAICNNGEVTLWSRSRKPIRSVPHIVKALEKMGKCHGDFIIDGELYNHDYHDNFEDLTHFIRQQVPIAGHEIVEYHIYDIPSVEDNFSKRLSTLQTFFHNWGEGGPLKLVETLEVYNEKQLMDAHKRGVEQGYEGVMARNGEGLYKQNRRSYDLLKVKRMVDEEFKVVEVKEGRGKLVGHAIFVVETNKGERFGAKMAGDTADLKKYVDNPKLALGRMLTIQFQGYTKYGIPRFPVAQRFKEVI